MIPPKTVETASPHTSLVALDLARGLAALLVLFEHCRSLAFVPFNALPPSQHGLAVRALYLTLRLGEEAVLVFFVLSGFLVGGQVIRRVREQRFKLDDYAIDRLTRILLPLVPAVLIAEAVGVFGHGLPFSLWRVVANCVGLNGILAGAEPFDAPLWSLAYEIWFYVLAGAAALFLTGRGSLAALVAVFLGVLAFCWLEGFYLLFWAAGAFVAVLPRQRRQGWIALVGLLFLLVGTALAELGRKSDALMTITLLPRPATLGIVALGVVLCMPLLSDRTLDGWLRRVPGLAAFASSLAAFSYTLYLTHYPLLGVLTLYVHPQPLSLVSMGIFGGGLILSLVFAIALYWLFERNTPAARRWLRARFRRT